eukprot:4076874-Pleurochrysis_carterae.AAC.1
MASFWVTECVCSMGGNVTFLRGWQATLWGGIGRLPQPHFDSNRFISRVCRWQAGYRLCLVLLLKALFL